MKKISLLSGCAVLSLLLLAGLSSGGCSGKPEPVPSDSPIKPVDAAKQSQFVPESEAGPEKRHKVK